MNVIARLEFELDYYDDASKHFSHYATGTPRNIFYHDQMETNYKQEEIKIKNVT